MSQVRCKTDALASKCCKYQTDEKNTVKIWGNLAKFASKIVQIPCKMQGYSLQMLQVEGKQESENKNPKLSRKKSPNNFPPNFKRHVTATVLQLPKHIWSRSSYERRQSPNRQEAKIAMKAMPSGNDDDDAVQEELRGIWELKRRSHTDFHSFHIRSFFTLCLYWTTVAVLRLASI